MPKIIVKCDGGKDELPVYESYVDSMGDIVIVLALSGWGECSECEESQKLKQIRKRYEDNQEAKCAEELAK